MEPLFMSKQVTPPKAVPSLYTRTPPSLVWADGQIRSNLSHTNHSERKATEVKYPRGSHAALERFKMNGAAINIPKHFRTVAAAQKNCMCMFLGAE